ncbi:MAG: proton-conducting transporter membrane subunit [Gemmataceae bacterium]
MLDLDAERLAATLGLVVIAAPLALTMLLGVLSLIGRVPTETTTSRFVYTANVVGLVASIAVLLTMLVTGTRHVVVDLGEWVAAPHFHFHVKFVFDRLSVPFAILSYVLCGTIGAFASRYMHRERGFNRFHVLFAVFALGMVVTSLACTIETLFTGWEFVGLSSALLVAYFQERPMPARNGLRVWVVYRVADAAFLVAAVVMHHLSTGGDFDHLLNGGPWPDGQTLVPAGPALAVGLLLLIAAAGKSALVPFSGWLPRAMEGPTPSSAIFYGALSVHLGAFLLLRVSPLLDASIWLCAAVVMIGLTTTAYAYLAATVQTDIKSALSFASLVQVGLIVAEIGLGFRYIALIHILGNACLRTLQFLRAPSLLHDYRLLENAIGDRLPRGGTVLTPLTGGFRLRLYRFALERGYLDEMLVRYVVTPFMATFRLCDSLERRWTALLSGQSVRQAPTKTPPVPVEELV